MAQPTPYEPAYSFLTIESSESWFPGTEIDVELNAIQDTLDEVLDNLALIQRDDGTLALAATTAIPAGGTAGLGYTFSSTANFGVFFGSGAPTLTAAKGSLYLRSDGSSTSTRMYVNTNGATTWTAVTTVA